MANKLSRFQFVSRTRSNQKENEGSLTDRGRVILPANFFSQRKIRGKTLDDFEFFLPGIDIKAHEVAIRFLKSETDCEGFTAWKIYRFKDPKNKSRKTTGFLELSSLLQEHYKVRKGKEEDKKRKRWILDLSKWDSSEGVLIVSLKGTLTPK